MFETYKFIYKDVNTHSKFQVFSRTQEFADKLIERINKLGTFTLRPAKHRFRTRMVTETPPYELEQEQLKTVEQWEESYKKYQNDHQNSN